MIVEVTGTPRKRATLQLEQEGMSPAQLTEILQSHVVGEKDGTALIPAIFRTCPPVCRNHEKAGFVDCGGGVLHRLKDNVQAMTMFGADLDDVPEEAFAQALEALHVKGLMFWAWNTHSHLEGSGTVRARILIPFHKPLEIVSAKQWSAGAWPNLVRWLGLDGAAAADSACRDPSRVYYLPRKPTDAPTHDSIFHDGAPLDWEAVLGSSLDGFRSPVAMAPTAPSEDPSRPVDLEDFRERLRTVKKQETRALIARGLNGEPLTSPPDQRKEGEPSRYVAWRQLTGAMAAKAEDWESSEALLSVVRAAHTAEANQSPTDYTEWEIIEHLFATARAGIPQLRAEWDAQRAADRDMFLRIVREHAERVKGPEPGNFEGASDVDPSAFVEGASAEGPAPEVDWTEGLQLKQTKEGLIVESCAANVEHVIRHHPAWRGTLRFNEYTREVELHGSPVGIPGHTIQLKDNHAGLVADWLSRDKYLNLRVKDHVVWSRILIVAEANGYDPLKEYLSGLQWDGIERISKGPQVYFGATPTDDLGRDISEYLSTTFRKWLVSAVARGLRPGCKVDTVLHLEGKQGVGKSRALRVLGGEFFSETAIDIHSKDSWAACSTNWIIELGELETFRRTEVTAQKRFFALCEDQYRPPYGRAAIKAPRRCVFVGTTNTDDYLSDPTGERRHWPIAVGELDLDALARDRDQLWAEAVALFKAGHQWHLTAEEAEIQAQQAALRSTAGDTLEEAILAWWLAKGDRRPTEVTTHMVCVEVLEDNVGRGVEIRVGHALRALGFIRQRREVLGKTARFYVPTAELLNLRAIQAPTAAQLIARSKGIGLIPSPLTGV